MTLYSLMTYLYVSEDHEAQAREQIREIIQIDSSLKALRPEVSGTNKAGRLMIQFVFDEENSGHAEEIATSSLHHLLEAVNAKNFATRIQLGSNILSYA